MKKKITTFSVVKAALLYVVFLCVGCISVSAQLSQPGNPPGFEQPALQSNIPFVSMPEFDTDFLIAEDMVLDTIPDIPWRFGENLPVNLNMDNAGRWEELPDGTRIWQLGISSSGAYSLNLTFNQYQLPEGASLFVYDPDRAFVLGAFTHLNNQENGYFATTLIPGDSLIVEYIEPPHVSFPGVLSLETVTHAYRDPGWFTKAFGQSGWCNLNVACEEAAGWEDQVNAVVMLVVGSNGFCTGALINNTRNDARPFLLSANHCYRDPSTVVVWFNWESETCENPSVSPPRDVLSGARNRARHANSDFWLLELNHEVPESYHPFFAGWNRSLEGDITDTIIGIHHPRGDIKKFSYAEEGVQAARYLGDPGSGTTHWHIVWSGGTTTEPGSSGSPIFDGEGRIIGQLHGGWAACGNTRPDWYGRFGVSWTGGMQESNSLQPWLDPLGSNPQTLSGLRPGAARVEEVGDFSSLADTTATTLVWLLNGDDDPVMIAYHDNEQFGLPVGSYETGEMIEGGGKVGYIGYDNHVLLEGLEPGTTYYFKAWSFNQDFEYAEGVSTFATTKCPAFQQLPYEELITRNRMPACWEQHFIQENLPWEVMHDHAHPLIGSPEGNYNLVFNRQQAPSGITRLQLPPVSYGGFHHGEISFNYANPTAGGKTDILRLLYRSDQDEAWEVLSSYTTAQANWASVVMELPETHEPFQLAFQAEARGGGGVFLDAVSIEGLYESGLPPATNLRVQETNAHSIALRWTPPNSTDDVDLRGYRIFRDGFLIEFIDEPGANSFIDNGLPIGDYSYYISSVFGPKLQNSGPSNTVHATIEDFGGSHLLKLETSGAGSLRPAAGNYRYNDQAVLHVEALPEGDHQLTQWLINGQPAAADNPFHFSLTGDKNIRAVFEVTLATQTPQEYSFSVFPNPAEDRLQIEWNSGMAVSEVRLVDVNGRLLIHHAVEAFSDQEGIELSVGSLPPGLYFVQLRSQAKHLIQKIVVF